VGITIAVSASTPSATSIGTPNAVPASSVDSGVKGLPSPGPQFNATSTIKPTVVETVSPTATTGSAIFTGVGVQIDLPKRWLGALAGVTVLLLSW